MFDICKNLAGLQLNDTDTLNSLDELSSQYYSHSRDLYECISTTLDGESITIEDVDKFLSLMDLVLYPPNKSRRWFVKPDGVKMTIFNTTICLQSMETLGVE